MPLEISRNVVIVVEPGCNTRIRPACWMMKRRLVPSFALVKYTGADRSETVGSSAMRVVCACRDGASKNKIRKKMATLETRFIVSQGEACGVPPYWNASLFYELILKSLKCEICSHTFL